MRGQHERTGSLFSFPSCADRIPARPPLRRIRKLADQAPDRLRPTAWPLYPSDGWPTVPLEQVLLEPLNGTPRCSGHGEPLSRCPGCGVEASVKSKRAVERTAGACQWPPEKMVSILTPTFRNACPRWNSVPF
jgi:hypothetical protein